MLVQSVVQALACCGAVRMERLLKEGAHSLSVLSWRVRCESVRKECAEGVCGLSGLGERCAQAPGPQAAVASRCLHGSAMHAWGHNSAGCRRGSAATRIVIALTNGDNKGNAPPPLVILKHA